MMAIGSGSLLALSLALLAVRHAATAVGLAAAQGAMLGVVAVGAGRYPEAGVLLAANAVVLPGLLWILPAPSPRPPRLGPTIRLAAGAVLALLTGALGLPLVLVALGILVAAVARDRTVQAAGLLAMQNGLALAGLSLPVAERIAALVPAVPVLVLGAVLASQRRVR